MVFYIVLTLLGFMVLLSCLYFKIAIAITLKEQEGVQSIELSCQVPFYKFKESYDYSDPKLNLPEAFLVDTLNRGLATDKDFNLATLKNIFDKLSRLALVSKYGHIAASTFNMAMNFTVVDKLQWRSTIGGEDAMQTALHIGCFWAIKGCLAAFISSHSNLRELSLAVEPDFMKTIFLSNFTCILKIRIVHIITIAIYILVWKVRWWIDGITARAAEQQPSN